MHDHEQCKIEASAEIKADVEKYGFHICLFEADYLPAFVYTVGLYHTYKHPEILIFGLSHDAMGGILHGIVDEIKEGKKFVPNQLYDDLINNYPVQFLEVKEAHYRDYLGFGGGFYNNSWDFPALQMVWTDKKSKFPWEEGFNEDWALIQPLLDRNENFKFYEHRNLGVFTTKDVLEGAPILYVYHNDNGDWQFHSSDEPNLDNAVLVCLEDLVKRDPTLNELHYMGYGQNAHRESIEDDWDIEDDVREEENEENTEG
jgi:Domain of unknown function (DUF4262)